MPELTLLHESTVGEEEIDSLGHMNVRFYVSRVVAANRELLRRAGLISADSGEQRIRRADTYTKFVQEQFAGAQLVTLGGFVASGLVDIETSSATGIRTYFEIRNAEKGTLAAAFILRSERVDATSQAIAKAPDVDSLGAWSIEVPAHGRPRSLSLVEPTPVDFATVAAAVSDESVMGMMSGRRDGIVLPEDCDASGRLHEELDVMFLIARAQMENAGASLGPPVSTDSQGRRFSWAMMETRSIQYRRPAAGDKVVSFGADIAFSEKWRHARRWTYVVESGELLGIADSIGICIDLDARRALGIPPELLESIELHSVPHLA